MKEKRINVYLFHGSKGHYLCYAEPKEETSGCFGLPIILVRTWPKQTAEFFNFLKKQKNLKRMCPICTRDADRWEAKWNPDTKPRLLKGSLDL